MKLKEYTVVGLYQDNKQVYVGTVIAMTVPEAVLFTKKDMGKKRGADEQDSMTDAVLAVFGGKYNDLYGEDELYEE